MTSTDYGISELRALSSLIQSSIDKIEEGLAATGKVFPSPDTTFNVESEDGRTNPRVQAEIDNIVAAAAQLIAVTRSPISTLTLSAGQVRPCFYFYFYSLLITASVSRFVCFAYGHPGPRPGDTAKY